MQRNLLEPPVKSHPICLPGAVEHILPTWLRLERPGEKSIEKFGWCAIVRFFEEIKVWRINGFRRCQLLAKRAYLYNVRICASALGWSFCFLTHHLQDVKLNPQDRMVFAPVTCSGFGRGMHEAKETICTIRMAESPNRKGQDTHSQSVYPLVN